MYGIHRIEEMSKYRAVKDRHSGLDLKEDLMKCKREEED
jgi:hypothetical protein